MYTRLWLAGAATVAVVATGAIVTSSTLHGQASSRAPGQDTVPDATTLTRDIDRAVQAAIAQAGVLNSDVLGADLRRTIEQATRSAQDAVKALDVEVLVNDAMQDLPDLAMGGRPRIGVSTRDVTVEEAKAAGLPGITGAFVSEAPVDSAAGKAGLAARDIIVSVDGETIRSARQLPRVIGESPDGRALQIGYVRGTAKNTVAVTPDAGSPRAMTWNRRESGPMVWAGREGRVGPGANVRVWSSRGRLGVMAQPLTDQLATYFGVTTGVLVTQVTDASAAAKAGIKAGDVITAVNGKPVKDTSDILEHLQGVENGTVVPVDITRDKKAQTVSVTLETPSTTSGDRPVPRRQRFTA